MRALLVFGAVIIGAALPASASADAPSASASKAATPTIKRVSPMRVKVGHKIVIRGKGFSSKRSRNKILFRAKGRSAFAKVSRISRGRLVVKVPAAAEQLLTKAKGTAARAPTRLTVRVVTSRYGKASNPRHSPIVVSSGGAGCGRGSDWDLDLVPNSVELRYALDPCKADTDKDGLTDGWEYWSAKDLNLKDVPYPGKKPYPNPLQSGDTGYDFDGDSLEAVEEFKLWKASGSSYNSALANNGRRDSPLGYSDGTQDSRPTETPAVPAFINQSLKAGYPGLDVMRDDGKWSDDERDADADGLNNYMETSGPGRISWWPAFFAAKETGVQPWPATYYGPFTRRPFADLDPADGDVDGDTLLDGEDDQDDDDIANFYEMYDPSGVYSNGRRKNPYNPCAPDQGSRTCPRYEPL